MKNTINIQNEANIKAEGTHTYHTAKPIICIDTGEVYASVMDAVEQVGCHYSNMINHLKGRQRVCNGKHYCYLSRSTESLDHIVTRLRETAAMEEDARKWREYQAEQEAIRRAEEQRLEAERKEKEKRENDLLKAKSKLARRTEICERLANELARAEQRKMEAEIELEALLGVQDECVA
jgi:septal ring factor EnvC (AmiA/AmiB activator)